MTMQKFAIAAIAVLFAVPLQAADSPKKEAQDVRRDSVTPASAEAIDAAAVSSSSNVTPTPEMWLYSQENLRHDSPQLAVRRKAEARARARDARLESLRWYGLSNSRPTANPNLYFGPYAHGWAYNTTNPMQWQNYPNANTAWVRPLFLY